MTLKTKSVVSPIILAAGYSSRMKDFKPLLPLGDKSILESVIEVFQEAGFGDIHAVVGYRADDLKPVCEKLKIHQVVNRQFDRGMFSSILTGVKDLSPDREAFFIAPVDIPLIKKYVILELYRAFKKGKSKVYYPCFKGERGHPPLIDAGLIPEILRRRDMDNMSLILNRFEDSASDVETFDENVLFDVDTPSDYRLLLKKFRRRAPSTAECLALLEDKFKTRERIPAHCKKVASVALALGKALESEGSAPDLDLLYSASLLHDLMRERPKHAEHGAEFLTELGYPDAAELVAEHADISLVEESGAPEKEILYLADKLVENDKISTVEKRFGKKLKKYSGNPEVEKNIAKRKNKALKIQGKIEAILGRSVESILSDE